MTTTTSATVPNDFTQELSEWMEAFHDLLKTAGAAEGAHLLAALGEQAREAGIASAGTLVTRYKNTIPTSEEAPYPGNLEIEQRIEALIRWNATAMVTKQNKKDDGIGGHIATYGSLATLLEVGFNHFFHASYGDQPGDLIYLQGHSSPGIYARAFLEGRLSEDHLHNFRHELRDTPGLSSYPHPWLMPDFWRFPTVSMGIGPLNAIYQAHFMRYLESRKLIEKTPRKIWAYVGDGETDEVDTLGALSLAAREKLDNLIFVVNCNLQRLDGPVRGNKRIIDELEGVFRGAGWNVIKVLWGSDWDSLFARDRSGLLLKRMEECVDGEFQTYKAKDGAYLREHFFGKYPELLELVKDMSDEQLADLHRGGHDPVKVYNAYKRATEHTGGPTVILAKTVKGFGISTTQSRNPAHQEKKISEEALAGFVKHFNIPIPEETLKNIELYRPAKDSAEMTYLHERRAALGGYLPHRNAPEIAFKTPDLDYFKEWTEGSRGREVSTTMGFVSILRHLLKDPAFGKLIVPIVPDEGRTFGLESAIRQVGIYASEGQKYTPHDQGMLLYYREEQDGQILEEGITEAGSMACFTAAGTAYCNYRVPMIPFYMYYSMFGFQRVGDMIWAFADARGKGFLMGGTAGRTTMLGEGLQHQDGHSHVLASTVPTCVSYDPAYIYEMAVIMRDGLRRMYENNESVFYYITMYNEDYAMPEMPKGVEEGILRGLYRLRPAAKGKAVAQIFGSGTILREALRAQEILSEKYGVAADVWSVTSYNELRREALGVERWNRLHPGKPEKTPYLLDALKNAKGPIIAACDYMKVMADQLAPWLPSRLVALGTDGFGRSDNREHLRRHFEVNAESIAAATLSRLAREGKFDAAKAEKAYKELGLDTEKLDPAHA